MSFAGAIFDVDGVLVDSPHERAWRDTLRELMEGDWRDVRPRTSAMPPRASPSPLPAGGGGQAADGRRPSCAQHFGFPDVEAMAAVYADRKQRRIVELIAAGEFTAFPDALRMVLAVRAGIAIVTASSSKNAALFLRAIRPTSSPTAGPRPRLRAPRPGSARLRRR